MGVDKTWTPLLDPFLDPPNFLLKKKNNKKNNRILKKY